MEPPNKTAPLAQDHLPPELWEEILSRVPASQLKAPSGTCRLFNSLVDEVCRKYMAKTYGEAAILTTGEISCLAAVSQRRAFEGVPRVLSPWQGKLLTALLDQEYAVTLSETGNVQVIQINTLALVSEFKIPLEGPITEGFYKAKIQRSGDFLLFKVEYKSDERLPIGFQLWNFKTQKCISSPPLHATMEKFLAENKLLTFLPFENTLIIKDLSTNKIKIISARVISCYGKDSPVKQGYLFLSDRLLKLYDYTEIPYGQGFSQGIHTINSSAVFFFHKQQQNQIECVEMNAQKPINQWKRQVIPIHLTGLQFQDIAFFHRWVPENKSLLFLSHSASYLSKVDGNNIQTTTNTNFAPVNGMHGNLRQLRIQNGIAFMATEYGTVRMYEISTGRHLRTLKPDIGGTMYDIQVTPTKVICVNRLDGVVVWDFKPAT